MFRLMEKPYLLFLGDIRDDLSAKTARGIADWRPGDCVGQYRMAGCGVSLGLADLDFAEARERGARTLVVGVANAGGRIPGHWEGDLVRAVEVGLDIASGLHERLNDLPGLARAARASGRRLFDIRRPEGPLPVGTGEKRPGKRILTVGTDCSVGKKYTTLALADEMRRRGIPADFRATGQTGIFIAGEGICVDAVPADFISGVAERLSPAADPDHWDVVEGQGSLFHPSFAGVTLGLVHGAQPDFLVLCHEPGRESLRGLPGRSLPGLAECLDGHLAAARLTNPDVRAAGFSFNTRNLDPAKAERLRRETEAFWGLPCIDPVINGAGAIVDWLENQ